jgi:hypothetical protein
MLELYQGETKITTVAPGARFTLPNGDVVSPAYAGWTNGAFSLAQAPEPTPPSAEELLEAARAGMQLSFAQMLIGLVSEEWITEAEGEAWLTGTTPAAVTALIDTLPQGQRFAAKARAVRPSVVMRTDPLVIALATMQGKTEAELDAFFTTYAQV